MDIWVRVPLIKDFSIERATAQVGIKTDEVGYLSLAKEQITQIIQKSEHWLWAMDESANEGWVPKSMSKITTVLVPHLGIDVNFCVTVSIKNQMQKFEFEPEFESFFCQEAKIFSQVDWDDKVFIVIEAYHRAISTIKLSLSDFKESPLVVVQSELKHFKRSSASLVVQISEDPELVLEIPEPVTCDKPTINLISGEILRYTCPASSSCGSVYQIGKLSITNYRFLFTSGSIYDNVLSVPHFTIDNLQINLGLLTLTTKDLRTIDYFINQEYMRYVLDKSSELKGMYFCFDYHLAFHTLSDFGWSIYDPDREFTRMGAFDSGLYYRSEINIDYSFCDSYPSILYQPVSVSEEELKTIANFRSRRRIPTITWVGKGAALYRSSQPCVGVFYSRCKEDEEYMAKAGIMFIVDARPKVNARANKVKGKGFEHSAYYTSCKMHFMNIPNIHKIRASYEALKGIVGKEEFLLYLNNSKWMHYLKAVLSAAKAVADFLVYQRVSILVHCSDGWDRTSQICSTAQLLSDPFYRTFHGFQVLICKDWLSFGYKFKDRSSSGSDGSPIFLQFLDGVSQIMKQNPNEFQFSPKYLLFLVEALYSGKYGTFMADNEKDLRAYVDNTVSVWKEERAEFFNEGYSPTISDVLNVNTSIPSLVFWEYFYQWNAR